MRWHTKGGHDVPTLAGIAVVAVAAAVLSFASLQALAQRAGYAPGLAALLPIAIDAQAVVATRAWLSWGTLPPARRYARLLALTAVALSVIGNAGEHAMAAAAVLTPWWVVVLVSAVPPIALAATAHLGALLATRSDRPASIELDTTSPANVGRALPAAEAPVVPDGLADVQESRSTRSKPAARPSRSIEQLRSELATAIETPAIEIDPTSAESIRRTLRCSPKRARQLRDEYATRPHLAVVGENL